MEGFSPRDVHRAFRKFNDLASELASAGIASWRGLLKRLIHHCTANPVMRVVSEPLRTRGGVDVNAWYESSMQHRTYELPCDDDEGLALLYQFLEAVNSRIVPVGHRGPSPPGGGRGVEQGHHVSLTVPTTTDSANHVNVHHLGLFAPQGMGESCCCVPPCKCNPHTYRQSAELDNHYADVSACGSGLCRPSLARLSEASWRRAIG